MTRNICYIMIGFVLLSLFTTGVQSGQQGTRILFDEYHAEWKPSLQFSRFIMALDREGYISDYSDEKIDSYLLAGYSILVLLAPSRDFEDYEKEAIRDFVEEGGSLLIFGEVGGTMTSQGILDPINSISTMFGIEFNADIVSDPEPENQIPDTETASRYAERFVIIRTFRRHPVTYNIFDFGYVEGCSLDVSSPALGLAMGNPTTEAGSLEGEDVIVLAVAEHGAGKVLAVGDKDFLVGGSRRFGAHDGFLVYGDNERLGLSIFEWAATQASEEADRDSDGVPDTSDGCYNPGCSVVDSQGCPKDTDGDGVDDCDDRCLREAGPSTNYGCPESTPDTEADADGDGIPDNQDQCFNPECALVDAQGCPKDSDDDGLDDCSDQCPDQYGQQDDGCPSLDSDYDGVPDDQDQCYNPDCRIVDSMGCPKDSDGDGVNDCLDGCPDRSGPFSNNGCPQGPQICTGTLLISILVALGAVLTLKK
ncbi:MAG: thrombospondin type 3 repeat-containing protein [Theionarchaea archaeon]|nr:thrombospondin type 3 repeat-containing protein [Theionarchaea archaeon]